ncbi:MAG: cupin domain-containing protein [Alteromonadaceae bacterium]|nr:cupin domain-containing protein [Alteromonadaceae bacterium]
MNTIQALIDKYQLTPHPEGGYFAETYRAEEEVASPVHNQPRNSVTQIYFLLAKGDVSRFHKVLHDEIWHFYEGAPLRLLDANNEQCEEILLGQDGRYHHVIAAHRYQAAESTGEYTLVGCTVAPGFDFADFNFLADDAQTMALKADCLQAQKRFI